MRQAATTGHRRVTLQDVAAALATLGTLAALSLATAAAAPPDSTPTAGAAAPARYALDPAHSFVQFELVHFGTSTIRGRLGPARGGVTLEPAAGRGEVSIEIPMASVDTGFGPFNAHLRGADLLAVEANPVAWFVSRRLRYTAPAAGSGEAPGLATLEGELTLLGVSRGLTLTATRYGCYTHPTLQREVCGGDFEGELLRSDYGINYGLPFVADRVRLKVQVEGVRTP